MLDNSTSFLTGLCHFNNLIFPSPIISWLCGRNLRRLSTVTLRPCRSYVEWSIFSLPISSSIMPSASSPNSSMKRIPLAVVISQVTGAKIRQILRTAKQFWGEITGFGVWFVLTGSLVRPKWEFGSSKLWSAFFVFFRHLAVGQADGEVVGGVFGVFSAKRGWHIWSVRIKFLPLHRL